MFPELSAPQPVPGVQVVPGRTKVWKLHAKSRHAGHRGWSLYSRRSNIRCMLKELKNSSPQRPFPDRPNLPKEIIWPVSNDFDGACKYIDAICDADAAALELFEKQYPYFHFLHSEYLNHLRSLGRRMQEAGAATDAVDVHLKASLTPVGAVESYRFCLRETVLNGMDISFCAVLWSSGDKTLEVTCCHEGRVFTKVVITQAGEYEVVEHNAAAYVLNGLNPSTWRAYLRLVPSAPLADDRGQGTIGTSERGTTWTSTPSTAHSTSSEPPSEKSGPSSDLRSGTGG